jgi:hypothetical protein
MDGLMEIVAASFARHGIECPSDSGSAWKRTPSPIQAHATADASVSLRLRSGLAPAEPTITAALPDHNYRKSMQGDPAP